MKTFQGKLSGGNLSYTDGTSLYYDGVGADEAVASCAWNLQVIAYDAAGNIINSTNDINNHPTSGPYTCDPNGSTAALPEAIEISFRVISNGPRARWPQPRQDETMAMKYGRSWTTRSASGDKTLYDNLIKPHVYDFRTRIHLR